MFVLGNFVSALATVVDILLSLYMWVVIISALISWVNPDPYNPVVRFLRQATDPVFERVRRFVPSAGGLDLSPVIVIVALIFLQNFLVPSLRELAANLR